MLDIIDPQPDICRSETIELSKRSPSTFQAIKSTKDPILSCVFDKNCTELFKAIDHKKWTDVAYFIDNAEWPGIGMFTPDFPPLQQTLTVVSGFEEDTQEAWTYLPLHLAIVRGAPLQVIDRLVSLAPKTMTIPDHDGNLALHLSLWVNSRYEVQKYLISANQGALTLPNTAGLTPVQCALAATDEVSITRGTIIHAFMKHAIMPPKSVKMNEIDLFCDYSTNCSPLFKRIALQDWDAVSKFLTDGIWPVQSTAAHILQFFGLYHENYDETSPTDQAMTLVIRYTMNKKMQWARLPIHLAIILGAPFTIIRKLVNLYPESLAFPDNEGYLPLHRALQCNCSDALIEFLISQCPEALRVRNLKHQSALAILVADTFHPHRGRVIQAFVNAAAQQQKKALKAAAKE